MQINNDYFEDLDESKTEEIIKKLLHDEFPKPGSAINRKSNNPEIIIRRRNMMIVYLINQPCLDVNAIKNRIQIVHIFLNRLQN